MAVGGKDRAEEGEVLGIEGGRVHVQRLVDLLPGCEARRRAWKGVAVVVVVEER